MIWYALVWKLPLARELAKRFRSCTHSVCIAPISSIDLSKRMGHDPDQALKNFWQAGRMIAFQGNMSAETSMYNSEYCCEN